MPRKKTDIFLKVFVSVVILYQVLSYINLDILIAFFPLHKLIPVRRVNRLPLI